jgi:hypothetical protein
LIELYSSHDFLQEPISAVFAKLLNILRQDHKQLGVQALEVIVEQLIVKKSENVLDFRQNVMCESNRLSLYMTLKKAQREGGYQGMSKEYEELFKYNLI